MPPFPIHARLRRSKGFVMSLNRLNTTRNQSSSDPELDEDTFETALSAVRGVQTVLARAAIEASLDAKTRRLVLSRSSSIVVFRVPGADWCEPVCLALLEMNSSIRPKPVTQRKRNGEFELPDSVLSDARGEIRPIVMVSQDPQTMLSSAQLGAADATIAVPAPDARLLRQVIKMVSGQRARKLSDPDVEGLNFSQLAAAIRLGSSAAECEERLRRAKAQPKPMLADQRLPRIEDLPLTQSARLFADELLDDIDALKRGDITAAQLQNAVLSGPPGTGKTLLAGALAKSIGWPFIKTSIADWFTRTDGYLSGVMKGATSFFDDLLMHDHAIGFIDELDSLPNRETMRDKDREWWTPVVNGVLLGIDRVKASSKPILLLGATNFGTRIDAAMIRPGRFDRIVPLMPPATLEELLAVFRYYLGKDLQQVDLIPTAMLAEGATPAAIEAWVKQARRTARSHNRPLELKDLTAAVAPSDERSALSLYQCAVHEAGHAVIAHALGIPVKRVTILQSEVAGGMTTLDSKDLPKTRAGIENMIMVGLAGRAADEQLGEGAGAGAAFDLLNATELIVSMHAGWGLGNLLSHRIGADSPFTLLRQDANLAQQVEDDLRRLKSRVDELVVANGSAIRSVAERLLQSRVLNGDDIGIAIAQSSTKTAKAGLGALKHVGGSFRPKLFE